MSAGQGRLLLGALVVLAFVASANSEDNPNKAAQTPRLEGLWKLTWGADRGKAVSNLFDIHWTIDAKLNLTIHSGEKAGPNGDRFELVVDEKKGTLDRKRDEKTVLGLYELKGDDLTVCFNLSSADRPRFIDSNSAYGYTVYTFKRVRPKDMK